MAKYCPNCGKPVTANAKFCPNCGAKIGEEDPASKPKSNMAEKAAKAAEAERRAKEEERKKKEQKKALRRQRREDFKDAIADKMSDAKSSWASFCSNGYQFILICVILAVLSIACGVFMIMNLVMRDPVILFISKIAFWASLGLFVADLVFFIIEIRHYDYEGDGFYIFDFLAVSITGVFMIITTLMSINGMSIKKYYYDKEGGAYYALKDKGYVVYGAHGNLENVTIRASIDGIPVYRVGSDSFKGNNFIKTLVFEEGAYMQIGDHAFYNCTNLTSIDFKNGYYTAYYCSFMDCTFLKNINLDGGEIVTDYDSTVRYAQRTTAMIMDDSKDTVLTIKDGKYHRVANNYGTIIVSGDVYLDGCIMAEYGYKELENQNLVLTPGFTFDNSTISAFRGKNLFSPNYNCIPFARNIYIPKSVTRIPRDFFGTDLSKSQYNGLSIYYEGTEEEWAQIEVDVSSGNEVYQNNQFTITYNKTYSE